MIASPGWRSHERIGESTARTDGPAIPLGSKSAGTTLVSNGLVLLALRTEFDGLLPGVTVVA